MNEIRNRWVQVGGRSRFHIIDLNRPESTYCGLALPVEIDTAEYIMGGLPECRMCFNRASEAVSLTSPWVRRAQARSLPAKVVAL